MRTRMNYQNCPLSLVHSGYIHDPELCEVALSRPMNAFLFSICRHIGRFYPDLVTDNSISTTGTRQLFPSGHPSQYVGFMVITSLSFWILGGSGLIASN